MPRCPLAVFAALLIGCDDVSGTWEGACVHEDTLYQESSTITLELKDEAGSTVTGDIEYTIYDGRELEGKLDGLRSDTYIELEGLARTAHPPTDPRYDPEPFELRLTGDLDADVIEGDCWMAVPFGVGALVGRLELAR